MFDVWMVGNSSRQVCIQHQEYKSTPVNLTHHFIPNKGSPSENI